MIINYSDQEIIEGKKSIFLAGPTPRGETVISWRTEACQLLGTKKITGYGSFYYKRRIWILVA